MVVQPHRWQAHGRTALPGPTETRRQTWEVPSLRQHRAHRGQGTGEHEEGAGGRERELAATIALSGGSLRVRDVQPPPPPAALPA